jgi:hypothetical protein
MVIFRLNRMLVDGRPLARVLLCHNSQMPYATVKAYKGEDFKRSTGAGWEMFEKLLAATIKQMHELGRLQALGGADQWLMTLM